jgi:DNA-binding transcriptional LysR family regulator
MRDLDLTSLRLWVAVCDHRNIARAAEAEHIAASAISKRIAQMESQLGTELLMRGRRGVQPTPAGLALLEHARTMLFTLERIDADISSYSGGMIGHVRMLATPSAIAEMLLDDVASFMAGNHGIKVDIEERLTRDVIRSLREGIASVGICWDNTDMAGVQHRPYRRDELAVAVHPDHPLARHKRLRFEQTFEYEQVSLPPASSVQIMLQRAAARAGHTITYRAIVSNFDAAFRVVAANLALGIMPREVGQQYAGLREVVMVPLAESWAMRRFAICFRDYDALQPAAQRMVDHLVRAAEAEAAGV